MEPEGSLPCSQEPALKGNLKSRTVKYDYGLCKLFLNASLQISTMNGKAVLTCPKWMKSDIPIQLLPKPCQHVRVGEEFGSPASKQADIIPSVSVLLVTKAYFCNVSQKSEVF
jgi:hypothetical protein